MLYGQYHTRYSKPAGEAIHECKKNPGKVFRDRANHANSRKLVYQGQLPLRNTR